MKPFAFNLLLLLQRADEALRAERLKRRPDPAALALLRRRKQGLAARLRRSFSQPLPAGI